MQPVTTEKHPMHAHTTPMRIAAALALGASLGCSGPTRTDRAQRDASTPTHLSAADFRDPDARSDQSPTDETRGDDPQRDDAQGGRDRVGAAPIDRSGGAGPAEDPGADPVGARRARMRTGEGLDFLDAKVGDINGHPIYVTSFFAPIEARLRSLSERESARAWQQSMFEIVKTRLDSIIFDELLRSETLAGLSPEQRVGLQSFLQQFRDDLLSQNLGSEQLANRRLQETQGLTLDQALRQKELDTLVSLTLHQKINRRVNVSWRDIQNRYERERERFNPPPTAVLRVIRLLGADETEIRAVTERLEGGEPFADIAASDINTFNTDEGGVHEVLIEDSLETTEFFAPDALNDAIRALEPGAWSGPITLGTASFWVEFVELRRESTPLYEAQLTIQRELTQERRARERAKYLADLIERAKVSSREEILLRLISVAQRLYAPAPREP